MKYLAVLLVVLALASSLILLNTIYPVLPGVANRTKNLGQKVTDNWRGFLFDKNKDETVLAPTERDIAADDAELAARIKAEVDKAVALRLEEIAKNQAGSASGLVVMPANQTSTKVEDITKSFSDEVQVYPDSSGQSGVIVPIFRDGEKGLPYLYVLTPIKQ